MIGGGGVFECNFHQRAALGVHRGFPELIGIHFTESLVALDADALCAEFQNQLIALDDVHRIEFLLALGHAKQRWHRDEDFLLFYQRPHVAKEESQKQRANMRAVHVSICHDDDFIVAQIGYIKSFSDVCSKSNNKRFNFVVCEHFV